MASDFLGEHFLLSCDAARRLYFDYARAMPIFDYHCHLPPEQIAANHRFANLTEIWLGSRPLQVAGDARPRRRTRSWSPEAPTIAPSSGPGRRWCRTPSATRCTIGPTWSCAAHSGSTSCCRPPTPTPFTTAATSCSPPMRYACAACSKTSTCAPCALPTTPSDDLAAHRRIAADPAFSGGRRPGVSARQGGGRGRSRRLQRLPGPARRRGRRRHRQL